MAEYTDMDIEDNSGQDHDCSAPSETSRLAEEYTPKPTTSNKNNGPRQTELGDQHLKVTINTALL